MAFKRLGLIQSRGIGDIIIALPIAAYYAERGAEVLWPISESFIPHFSQAVDYVTFIPLPEDDENRWYYETPLAMLQERGCDKIMPMYNALKWPGYPVKADYSKALGFDEYKYKVAGVPFKEKWRLRISRNADREERLFSAFIKNQPYTLIHQQASDARINLRLEGGSATVVEITDATDCVFDWLTIMERASSMILIDSCFLNLANQLGIGPQEKFFIPKTSKQGTPKLGADWRMIGNYPR